MEKNENIVLVDAIDKNYDITIDDFNGNLITGFKYDFGFYIETTTGKEYKRKSNLIKKINKVIEKANFETKLSAWKKGKFMFYIDF